LMILPAVLALAGIMYPFLIGVLTSFTDKKLYSQTVKVVFFQNYINNLMNPVFRVSFLNTLLFTALAILLQIPLGIGAALILDTKTKILGFLRSILVFPLLIPPIVSGLMWKTMMQPASGVLGFFLKALGVGSFPFITGIKTVLFSLVIVDTWIYLPFTAIVLLSGLQSLPPDMLEAAQVDGASPLRVFFAIKMPWLKSCILLTMLFRVCDSLKAFDIIYAMTRGGPLNASRTLNIMAYEEAFRWSNTGQALSVIFTLWIIAYLVSSFLIKKWNVSAIEV
ncbi:MAG: sugar ABC transporter permease, partial [Spirochaetaceae bacterium]|nr:sugar ABC transporter permease [Spirochaetaceae bacterium]